MHHLNNFILPIMAWQAEQNNKYFLLLESELIPQSNISFSL